MTRVLNHDMAKRLWVWRAAVAMATSLVIVVTLLGAVVAHSPPALACTAEQPFTIDLRDLRNGDPSAPLAHLQPAYDEWRSGLHPEEQFVTPRTPPELTAVWFERSVVVVDALAEDWIGDGGITVVDATWGDAQIQEPVRAWYVDNTSCADVFSFPDEGTFYAQARGATTVGIVQPQTDLERDQARAALTAIFGEPASEPVSIAQQRAALTEVVRNAEQDELAPLDIRLLDASAKAVLADGSFPWLIIVLGVVALSMGALFAFRPVRFRRR